MYGDDYSNFFLIYAGNMVTSSFCGRTLHSMVWQNPYKPPLLRLRKDHVLAFLVPSPKTWQQNALMSLKISSVFLLTMLKGQTGCLTSPVYIQPQQQPSLLDRKLTLIVSANHWYILRFFFFYIYHRPCTILTILYNLLYPVHITS